MFSDCKIRQLCCVILSVFFSCLLIGFLLHHPSVPACMSLTGGTKMPERIMLQLNVVTTLLSFSVITELVTKRK